VLNCRVAASGLKITEVPSMERDRIFGQSNLRTFADGTRVLRTLAAERRRAQLHRSERVKLEESSRALTPPGGFPVITPEMLAATGSDGVGALATAEGSADGALDSGLDNALDTALDSTGDPAGALHTGGLRTATAQSGPNGSGANGSGGNGSGANGAGHLATGPGALSASSAGEGTGHSTTGHSTTGHSTTGHGNGHTNGAAAIGQHDVPRIPVRRPGGEV